MMTVNIRQPHTHSRDNHPETSKTNSIADGETFKLVEQTDVWPACAAQRTWGFPKFYSHLYMDIGTCFVFRFSVPLNLFYRLDVVRRRGRLQRRRRRAAEKLPSRRRRVGRYRCLATRPPHFTIWTHSVGHPIAYDSIMWHVPLLKFIDLFLLWSSLSRLMNARPPQVSPVVIYLTVLNYVGGASTICFVCVRTYILVYKK